MEGCVCVCACVCARVWEQDPYTDRVVHATGVCVYSYTQHTLHTVD